ncbi:MAG: response regulator transcription factor [Proteobacteria bacterium]|nr:response regulator transcription factor [Pseudomonadota bacterium]
MIRIVIADDHKIFLQGLAALLGPVEDLEIVAQAENGREAVTTVLNEKPEVAILDISMPELTGIQAAREIRRKDLKTKIILLTLHKDPLTADNALKTGVDGYILKDNAFEELLYAVRTVLSGGTFISPSIAGEILDQRHQTRNQTPQLTRRETEILKLIATGLTNKTIAADLHISVKTVETHRTRIMRKLDLHNVAELVRYAIKEGLTDEF